MPTAFDWFVWNDPSASQVSDLVPGKRINFKIVVEDYDRKRPEKTYTPEGSFWLRATRLWADGLLVAAVSTADEEAVEQVEPAPMVREDSWGRIKATFDSPVSETAGKTR